VKAEEMAKLKENLDVQKKFAEKVAQNLYNFMLSFERVISFCNFKEDGL
jgi:hypothetical protein